MTKRNYETYEKTKITKEILDSVCVGDRIRCNDWKTFFTVVAVSGNYFFMSGKFFGAPEYSICEKKQCEYARNNFTEGSFRIGLDNLICGGCYNHNVVEDIVLLLEALEQGEAELSERRGTVDLNRLQIWRSKPEEEI